MKTVEFNEVHMKECVRIRDGYRCRKCGMTQREHVKKYGKRLDVHRQLPGTPYTVDGCIAICRACHRKGHGKPRRISRYDSVYLQVRLDSEVLRLARAVSALSDMDLQDWISDLANKAASEGLGMPPVARRMRTP